MPSKSQLRHGLWADEVGSHRALPPHALAQGVVRDRFAAVWISRAGPGLFASEAAGRHAITGPVLFDHAQGRHTYTPVTGVWDERWVVFGGSLGEELRRQGMLDPSRGAARAGWRGGDPVAVRGASTRRSAAAVRWPCPWQQA